MKKAIIQFLDNKRTIYVPDYIYLICELTEDMANNGVIDNQCFDDAYDFITYYFTRRCESVFKIQYLIPLGFFKLTSKQEEDGVLIYFSAQI